MCNKKALEVTTVHNVQLIHIQSQDNVIYIEKTSLCSLQVTVVYMAYRERVSTLMAPSSG